MVFCKWFLDQQEKRAKVRELVFENIKKQNDYFFKLGVLSEKEYFAQLLELDTKRYGITSTQH